MTAKRLLVWTPADHRLLGQSGNAMPYLVLGDKYARALRDCAGAQALLLPLADPADIPHWLDMVDGVMLTGSPSNVHPSHFGEHVADESLPLDRELRMRLTVVFESAHALVAR